jgi:hypothetical protein
MHINHGIKLIHEWGLDGNTSVYQNDADVALFTQLDTQGTHIRGGVGMQTPEQTNTYSSPSVYTSQPFSTCLQAYVEVEKLINRLIRLDQKIDSVSIAQKAVCFRDFTLWDTRFQGYLATTFEIVNANLLTVLNMRRLYAQTLLNDPTKGELGHDNFIDQYAMIVTLAELILKTRYNTSETRPDFSLAVPVSEAMFMTIMRCREQSVRHRALWLLATYPHREGIMNGPMAREILGDFVVFEERACKDSLNECSSVGAWICSRHRVSFQSFMQISRLGVQGMQRWRE